MDGAMFSNMKVDTRTSPYTMVWYQPSSGHLFPCVKHLLGQYEVSMNAWHTPGTELKITTNLPHIQSFSVTTTDTPRKMELNGKELVTVDYTPGSHSISQTVVLPTGEHVTVSLSWPRLEMDTTDLEFTVELTPDRKLEGKLGWECPVTTTTRWFTSISREATRTLETTSSRGTVTMRRSLGRNTNSLGLERLSSPRVLLLCTHRSIPT